MNSTLYWKNLKIHEFSGSLEPLEVERTKIFIGSSNWNQPYLSAFIDEIKIFNGSLNSSQVLDEYRSTDKTMKTTNMIIYAICFCVLVIIITVA